MNNYFYCHHNICLDVRRKMRQWKFTHRFWIPVHWLTKNYLQCTVRQQRPSKMTYPFFCLYDVVGAAVVVVVTIFFFFLLYVVVVASVDFFPRSNYLIHIFICHRIFYNIFFIVCMFIAVNSALITPIDSKTILFIFSRCKMTHNILSRPKIKIYICKNTHTQTLEYRRERERENKNTTATRNKNVDFSFPDGVGRFCAPCRYY